jgi:probable O-glycosylation ligase (exosortase A-associated)
VISIRDTLVLGTIFGSLPFCFFRPYIGVLVWSWIAYMNPHRLTWGARYYPVAQYVALATLAGFIIFPKDRNKLPMERETILLLLLTFVYTFTTFFALVPNDAWQEWDRTAKILLITFVTLMLCQDKKRLRGLLLTIAFSLGFYGFKGGIFSLLTGGAYKIWGPEDSFIGGNNEIGLALLMMLPIFFYLAKEEQNPKIKWLLQATFLLSIISIIFTYSRGSFLGLIAFTIMFIPKLKRKFLATAALIIVIILAIPYLPTEWIERMYTIKDYQEDSSAMGRINAWYFAINLALARPLVGGGFEAFDRNLFLIYAPEPYNFHDSHSIYFEVLGEHGFPGLILFLSLLLCCHLTLIKLKRTFKPIPSGQWICNYSNMLQLSLVGYMVNGAFLGLAYFDLYYHLVAVIIILKVLARKEYELWLKEKKSTIQKLATHQPFEATPKAY